MMKTHAYLYGCPHGGLRRVVGDGKGRRAGARVTGRGKSQITPHILNVGV